MSISIYLYLRYIYIRIIYIYTHHIYIYHICVCIYIYHMIYNILNTYIHSTNKWVLYQSAQAQVPTSGTRRSSAVQWWPKGTCPLGVRKRSQTFHMRPGRHLPGRAQAWDWYIIAQKWPNPRHVSIANGCVYVFLGKIPESNGWKPHFPYWSCHILVVEVYFFWPKYVFSSSGPGGNGCKIQATLKHQPHVRPHRDQRTEGKETILGLSDLWGVFVPRCL